MEAIAKLNDCPVSPRKMRLVADSIRGQQVDKALNILKFSQRRQYAIRLEKVVLSALANWQQLNQDARVEDGNVFVKAVFVDGGRQLKRIRTAPQGRAARIRKRSNHITVILDSKESKN
mgnify:FL=1